MALEELLTGLTAAIKENTAALKGGAITTKGATTTTEKASTTAKAPTVKFDDLKALGGKVMAEKGKPFAKKLIKDVGGAAELATVKPEKFAALFAAFTTAMEPADATEEAAEEDEDL